MTHSTPPNDAGAIPPEPAKVKRLIRCFCVPAFPGGPFHSPGDVMAFACDEEGKTISQHYCSNKLFARTDIISSTHLEKYAKRYPEGCHTEWVETPPAEWEGNMPAQNNAGPAGDKVIGSGFYRDAAPGTFGPSEWLDLLMACQDGRATCMRVLEYIERETIPAGRKMAPDQSIKELVEAFLRWPLPDSVCSDLCVTRRGSGRVGTNLMDYNEAFAMMKDLVGPVIERLRVERDRAVAFAVKVEHGEVRFGKQVDEQMRAIAALPLGKTVDESLSQSVDRVLKERDDLRAELARLRKQCEIDTPTRSAPTVAAKGTPEYQHSMSCPFPEGCSCGATEWNNLSRALTSAREEVATIKANAMAALQGIEEAGERILKDRDALRQRVDQLEANLKQVCLAHQHERETVVTLQGDKERLVQSVETLETLRDQLRGADTGKANLRARLASCEAALTACDKAFVSWQVGQIPGRPKDILALIEQVRACLNGTPVRYEAAGRDGETPLTDAIWRKTEHLDFKESFKEMHDHAERQEKQLAALRDENARLRTKADECWGAANYRLKYLASLYRALGMTVNEESIESQRLEASELATKLRQRVAELEKHLAVEQQWVKSLTADNGNLLKAADATVAGAECVSLHGRNEELQRQIATLRARVDELTATLERCAADGDRRFAEGTEQQARITTLETQLAEKTKEGGK